MGTVGMPPGWPQMAVKKKAGSPNSLVACLGEGVPPGRTGTDWDELGWVGRLVVCSLCDGLTVGCLGRGSVGKLFQMFFSLRKLPIEVGCNL